MKTDYSKNYYTPEEWNRQRLWVVIRPNNLSPCRGAKYYLGQDPVITFGFSDVKPIKGDRCVFRFFPPKQKEYEYRSCRAWWSLITEGADYQTFWPERLKYKEMILHDPRERLLHS